jgi:hypothetical protein
MKTVTGFEPLCDFYIGCKPEVALDLFRQLEGSDEVQETDILQLDFMELKNGLPVNVKIKHCSLSQMSSNCSLLTKEIFKYRNLAGNI